VWVCCVFVGGGVGGLCVWCGGWGVCVCGGGVSGMCVCGV